VERGELAAAHLATSDGGAAGVDDDGFGHLETPYILPRIIALEGTPTPAVTSA
jgi:hypothetical protein